MASPPPRESPLVEPVPIAEEFASGLAYCRVVGDVTHLIFYVDQPPAPETPGPIGRRIVRKLVMPNDARDRMLALLQSECAAPTHPPAGGGIH